MTTCDRAQQLVVSRRVNSTVRAYLMRKNERDLLAKLDVLSVL